MSVGTIHPLRSGGVLVDVGDEFPIWREDAGAARRLLLDRDLNPPASVGSGGSAVPPFSGSGTANAEVAA